MPPIVKALTGLCLGIVMSRTPSVITNVFPLPHDPEASLLKRPYGVLVIDSWNPRHALRSDLDLTHDSPNQ